MNWARLQCYPPGRSLGLNKPYFFLSSSNGCRSITSFPFGTLMFLILSSPFVFGRMRTQPCGFTGLVPEQCHPFQAAPITVYRDRLSRLLDTVRLSSRHRITEVLITQISTFLRPASLWTISSKTLETGPSVALKANNLQGSPNRYGKTATNLIPPVFQGLVMSLKAANQAVPTVG